MLCLNKFESEKMLGLEKGPKQNCVKKNCIQNLVEKFIDLYEVQKFLVSPCVGERV